MRTTDHAATETGKTQTQDINFFVQKALENNPQLKAGKYMENEALLLQESETIITEDPMLALKYSNVPLSTFPALNRDTTSGVGVMLSQTIALPGEAGSRKNKAWHEYVSRKENLADMQRMISYRVRTVFQDLNFFYQKKNRLVESQNSLNGIVLVARAMVLVNKMNSANLLKLEANLSKIQNEILETQGFISKTESAMEELTGIRPDINKIRFKKFLPKEISLPARDDVKSHPAYQKALADMNQAMARKNNEISKYFPSINLSAEYMFRQSVAGSMGEDMISLSVSAPLPLFFPVRQSKAVLAAEENINAARSNLEQTYLYLNTAVSGEYAMAEKLRDVYKRYHEDTLPKLAASYSAMVGSISSGNVSLLDVLDSYRDYLEVSIKESETYRDLQKSIAMLEYLGGEIHENEKQK